METPVTAGAEPRTQKDGELSRWQRRVLDLVRVSEEPLSAYALLRLLKEDGITAPPVVYRALKALQDRGLVHRIESLNAYVPCDDPEHDHAGQFAICRRCGRVEEISDAGVDRLLDDWTERLGFAAERRTIEILGLCAACRS
jgi:Fur family zinc uptake transcriptional regulator